MNSGYSPIGESPIQNMAKKQKGARVGRLSHIHMFRTISRILYLRRDDSYLSGTAVTDRLERFSPPRRSTILHARTDFAVSPFCFQKIIPEGIHCLSAPASLLAPLSLRTMGVTHYV